MNLFSITSFSISKGLSALSKLGNAVTGGVLTYLKPADGETQPEDLEMISYVGSDDMSAFQGLPPDPDNIAGTNRALAIASNFVIHYIGSIRMPSFQRLKIFREMKSSTKSWILIVAAAILTINRVFDPLASIPTQAQIHKWSQVLNDDATWSFFGPQHQHSLIKPSIADFPGVYIVVSDEALPDINEQTSNTVPIQINPFGQETLPVMMADPRTSFYHETAESRCENVRGLSHHAYPRHRGKFNKCGNLLEVRAQLQSCATSMLARLNGQGLELTPNLEFALHNCKSVIDFALETFYPPETPITVHSPVLTRRTVAAYGVVPGQVDPAVPAPSTSSQVQPTTKLNQCTDNFCGWVAEGNLDRCYHRNYTEYRDHGKVQYLNTSVDDFKNHAPLECALCLPSTDVRGIEVHCKEVEAAENRMVIYILGAAAVGLCVSSGMILGKIFWDRRRAAARARDGDDILLGNRSGQRTPVMPPAFPPLRQPS